MKLKVFTEPIPQEEKPLYLKLQQGRERVTLHLVDENGEHITGGNLLSIGKDGVYLHPAVSPDFGFELDVAERLKIIRP